MSSTLHNYPDHLVYFESLQDISKIDNEISRMNPTMSESDKVMINSKICQYSGKYTKSSFASESVSKSLQMNFADWICHQNYLFM